MHLVEFVEGDLAIEVVEAAVLVVLLARLPLRNLVEREEHAVVDPDTLMYGSDFLKKFEF